MSIWSWLLGVVMGGAAAWYVLGRGLLGGGATPGGKSMLPSPSVRWLREAYGALRFPVRALHIGDDLYAPRSGVEALVSFYGGPREVRTITPAQAGARSIGHFGWVRPRFEDAIWAPIRDWLLDRLLPSPLRRVG